MNTNGTLKVALVTGALAVFLAGCWERPPTEAKQQGFRGTGMEEVKNPRMEKELVALNQLPEVPWEPDTTGPRARDVYENVQVLGHLSEDQFNRLMASITEWISPEEGCNYCHNPENLADDSVYTKVVARRMIQMTWTINSNWKQHVGNTGVTCYTCHRGNAVPEYVWSTEDGDPGAGGFAASRQGQNIAGENVGLTSLPRDPFTKYLSGDENIRVQGATALPAAWPMDTKDTKESEWNYGLMMHMSTGLGENCTYCHNSRAFSSWEQSPPARVTAWHGIRMARTINNTYMDPLEPVFPDNRKGPAGDVLKANCATCHQGVNKPLYGQPMLDDYPELRASREVTRVIGRGFGDGGNMRDCSRLYL